MYIPYHILLSSGEKRPSNLLSNVSTRPANLQEYRDDIEGQSSRQTTLRKRYWDGTLSSQSNANVSMPRECFVLLSELGQPPNFEHETGVDAKTFQNFRWRADSCLWISCATDVTLLEENFELVDFREPHYCAPLNNPANVYITLLVISGILEASRPNAHFAHPYYEYCGHRELRRLLDITKAKERLDEVTNTVMVLSMFETVRLSPRTEIHWSAIKRFVGMRGGIEELPQLVQEAIINADLIQAICYGRTPVFGNTEEPCSRSFPNKHLPAERASYLLSSPLFLYEGEDFSSLARFFADSNIAHTLELILRSTLGVVQQLIDPQQRQDDTAVAASRHMYFQDLADRVAGRSVRTAVYPLMGVNDHQQHSLYAITLVGIAAASKPHERSYFAAQLMRSCLTHGRYQPGILVKHLANFIKLREALSRRLYTQTSEVDDKADTEEAPRASLARRVSLPFRGLN
ncbi:hypothetical protein QBC46DRAFT_441457 [Diplogelasinospora grovesii]|uniref:Uncharacterized protein n=1 Tax=Diplogelasinospora grovesii TaxID=303347 RepID=A0AAN6S2K5_9PEZI|nr:hypothetical protein QBC46DRAFT_441457 [Diplogelasinospora grovesii]